MQRIANAGKCRILNTAKITMQDMQDRIVSIQGLKRQKHSKYIISYGGGINSTAMMVFIIENKYPVDAVVFSDTGGERPETYAYLNHTKRYLKRHSIPFVEVMNFRKQSLFDKSMRRRVIPSAVWRWCTRDFKVLPIYRYYKKLDSHIYQYVGIAYDELHRMKDPKESYVTNVYPLVDFGIDREQCVKIIKNAKLPIPIKSGCYFCPFNSIERWQELYQKYPELYENAKCLEEGSKHFPEQKLTPLTLRVLEEEFQKGNIPSGHIESPCGNECMI